MANLREQCAALAKMTPHEIRTLELNPMVYGYSIKRCKSRVMRFDDVVVFVLEHKLEVVGCRACFFRMESCCVARLTNKETSFFFQYVADAIEGDPMHGFLNKHPTAEPFLFLKAQMIPFCENYVDGMINHLYEVQPSMLDLM